MIQDFLIEIVALIIFSVILVIAIKIKDYDEDRNFIVSLLISLTSLILSVIIRVFSIPKSDDFNEMIYDTKKTNWWGISTIFVMFSLITAVYFSTNSSNKKLLTYIGVTCQMILIMIYSYILLVGYFAVWI